MESIVLIVVGAVMAAVGVIYPTLTLKRRSACKAKVKATVVKVEKKTHYVGERTEHKYLPTFAYTVNVREYVTKSDLETLNMLKYKEGDEVTIRYNPDSPEIISVGVKVFPYVCGVLLLLFGGALIICSL